MNESVFQTSAEPQYPTLPQVTPPYVVNTGTNIYKLVNIGTNVYQHVNIGTNVY